MFEKYTEKARRVIFFARYEASQSGSLAIEAEHLLLGLMRENRPLIEKLLGPPLSTIESIRKEIESYIGQGKMVPESVDLPLSQSAKRALEMAAYEGELLGHRYIDTGHLLIGVIKEGKSLASQLLIRHGVSAEGVAAQIGRDEMVDIDVHELQPTAGNLFAQLRELIETLVRRGVITREKMDVSPAGREDLINFQASFHSLLDLLVTKGVIDEDDKRAITKLDH